MASSDSSAVTSSARRTGDGGPRGGQGRRGGAEALAQVGPLGPQLLDPLVGVVEVGEAGRGLLGPGHHLVDGLAVLPGERRERGSALGHDRQPGRVGLEPRGVRRDVGRDVGEQVGDLGQPVGELAGLGVVVADAVEEARGPPTWWPGRRAGPGRWRAPRGPARRRCGARRRSPRRASSAARAVSSPGSGSTASTSPSPNRSRSASRARSRAVATTSSSSRSVVSRRSWSDV